MQRRELMLDLLVKGHFGDDGQGLGVTTDQKGCPYSLNQGHGQLRLQLRKGPRTVAHVSICPLLPNHVTTAAPAFPIVSYFFFIQFQGLIYPSSLLF